MIPAIQSSGAEVAGSSPVVPAILSSPAFHVQPFKSRPRMTGTYNQKDIDIDFARKRFRF
jgi:hypothetical protein